jgi:hypothetical protein
MMIRVFSNETIWPYSLGQLRADELTFSFSSSPSPAELAMFGVFRVVPQSQPQPDPATEKVVEVQPAEADGQWLQQWELVALSEAEAAAYYLATHPPQWIAFSEALPDDVNTLLQQAQTLDHRLYGGLMVGLGKAADGDSRVFLGAWQKARAAGLIPAEMVTGLQTLAAAHDLPAEFIAGLGDAPWQWPDAPVRFQQWTAPDGSEWTYDQPRDPATGQYVTDDPATPESESAMQWLTVEAES